MFLSMFFLASSAFAGPSFLLVIRTPNVEFPYAGPETIATIYVASEAAGQALYSSYTNTGGYYEGYPVTGSVDRHNQDGRIGGGPSCEEVPCYRVKPDGKKWLEIESEEPHDWTNPAEFLHIPVLDDAEADKFLKKAEKEEFAGKTIKVEIKDK